MAAELEVRAPRRTRRAGDAVRSHVSGMPRAFWFVWTGQLANRLGSVVVPFLSLYLTASLGHSVQQAGALVALYGVGALCAQIVGGVLADHIGRRRTMLGGMTAAAVSMLALSGAHGTAALALLVLTTGFTTDLYRPASSALVADLVGSELRVRAYGLMFWAINLGWAVATVSGGLLARHAGYRALFFVDAATTMVCVVVIASGVPETLPSRAVRAERAALAGVPAAGLASVLRDRTLLAMVGLTVAGATVYMQSTITLPLVMVRHGLSTAAYGVVAAANGIVIVLVQPFFVSRSSRSRRVPVLVGAHLLIGVGFALTRLAGHSLLAYVATVCVWTVGEVLQAGLYTAVISDLAPPELRGRYMGVWGFSFGVSFALAPLIGTAVLGMSARAGETALWAGCLVISVAVAVGLTALEPTLERRGAAGPRRVS